MHYNNIQLDLFHRGSVNYLEDKKIHLALAFVGRIQRAAGGKMNST